MQYDIKSMVKDGKRVKFVHYRHKELWYETECGFQFAVPVEDTGEATFLAEDKAMFFMRYIRKQIDSVKAGMLESLVNEQADLGYSPRGVGSVPNCC